MTEFQFVQEEVCLPLLYRICFKAYSEFFLDVIMVIIGVIIIVNSIKNHLVMLLLLIVSFFLGACDVKFLFMMDKFLEILL